MAAVPHLRVLLLFLQSAAKVLQRLLVANAKHCFDLPGQYFFSIVEKIVITDMEFLPLGLEAIFPLVQSMYRLHQFLPAGGPGKLPVGLLPSVFLRDPAIRIYGFGG